jgi:hypothetical protein
VLKDLNLRELRRNPKIGFYFRYPLHASDFRELRDHGRLLGYFAAKPLYERLTVEGKVDRSGGFSGRIAVIVIPSPARSIHRARLVFAVMDPEDVTLADGRRNWPAIRSAAEYAARMALRGERH